MTSVAIKQDSRIRFLLIAVTLHAIVGIDYWVLQTGSTGDWTQGTRCAVYSLFVVEVALLGIIAGRLIESILIRAIVYVWTLILIDLLVYTVAITYSRDPLGYALFSAQIGMLVIWAMLGATHWAWRLPISLVVASLLAIQVFSVNEMWYTKEWPSVLLSQSAATIAICIALRFLGVRVVGVHQTDSRDRGDDRMKTRQFTIGHMFFWMTTTAIVLKLSSGMSHSVSQAISSVGLVSIVSIGGGLAAASLVALWSALGKGPLLLRLIMPLIVGWGVGTQSMYVAELMRGKAATLAKLKYGANYRSSVAWYDMNTLREYSPSSYMIIEAGDAWIVWCMLSSCFLAAFLVVFRASGYRLVRRSKTAIAVAKSSGQDPSELGLRKTETSNQ